MAKKHSEVAWAPSSSGYRFSYHVTVALIGSVFGIVLRWVVFACAPTATTTFSILLWSYLIFSDNHVHRSGPVRTPRLWRTGWAHTQEVKICTAVFYVWRNRHTHSERIQIFPNASSTMFHSHNKFSPES